jgi:hypothetical protein
VLRGDARLLLVGRRKRLRKRKAIGLGTRLERRRFETEECCRRSFVMHALSLDCKPKFSVYVRDGNSDKLQQRWNKPGSKCTDHLKRTLSLALAARNLTYNRFFHSSVLAFTLMLFQLCP